MYGKIFRQMYKGTLAMVGPWEALVTFQQMIVLSDREGVVDMTADAISRETTIPLPIIQTGIDALEQPDPQSRSPAEEGRRIIRLSDTRPWGWYITNYDYYRNLKREEDRREYHRQYWHKRKTQQKTQQLNTNSTHSTDAEAYADARSKKKNQDMSDKSDIDRVFDHWRQIHNHPRAQLDAKRRTLIQKRLREYPQADLCMSISGFLNSPHHMGQNDRGTRYDDIEIFLRDAKHIDMGLKFYTEPPGAQSVQTRKNLAATDGWLPPEIRNAKH